LAAKNNEYIEYPETITIIAEPSFGSAVKLLLVGAVIGAAAMQYLRKPAAPAAAPFVPPGQDTRNEQLNKRVQSLAKSVASLAGKAGSAAKMASRAVTPAIKNAVAEGRRAARETIDSIDDDLENEPDTKYASEGERLEAEREAEAKRLGLDHGV
jgi:hypothetical protein